MGWKLPNELFSTSSSHWLRNSALERHRSTWSTDSSSPRTSGLDPTCDQRRRHHCLSTVLPSVTKLFRLLLLVLPLHVKFAPSLAVVHSSSGVHSLDFCSTSEVTLSLLDTFIDHVINLLTYLLTWINTYLKQSSAWPCDISHNTLCSEKKHPLTFSFISPWIICGFKQKLQWIYPRIDRFWQCQN